MLLSDSYVKGLSNFGGIDWKTGLDAMIKDAEVSPPDWGLEGRGGIEARKKFGYVPADRPGPGNAPNATNVTPGRTASRTIEYAYNDFSIALVAAGEGRKDVYDDFVKRSGDWQNLWNPELVSDGWKGFIQPRFVNGSFAFQDPRRCAPSFEFGTCYLNPGELCSGREAYHNQLTDSAFFSQTEENSTKPPAFSTATVSHMRCTRWLV